MNLDKKRNDAVIILIEREAGSTKKTGTLPMQSPKWKGELEADDCYNSTPEENHPFHEAPSLTGGDSGSCVGGGRRETGEVGGGGVGKLTRSY